MNVIHFLFEKFNGENILCIVIIFPNFVVLLFWAFNLACQSFECVQISFCFELAQDTVGSLFFEIAHYIRQWVVPGKLSGEVNMIGHNHKTEKLHALAQAKTIKGIQDKALDDISVEDVQVIHGFGGDKVQVVGVKVWFPGGHGCSFPVDLTIRRSVKNAVLDLAIPLERYFTRNII